MEVSDFGPLCTYSESLTAQRDLSGGVFQIVKSFTFDDEEADKTKLDGPL